MVIFLEVIANIQLSFKIKIDLPFKILDRVISYEYLFRRKIAYKKTVNILKEEHIPRDWKTSVICSILKKEEKITVNN